MFLIIFPKIPNLKFSINTLRNLLFPFKRGYYPPPLFNIQTKIIILFQLWNHKLRYYSELFIYVSVYVCMNMLLPENNKINSDKKINKRNCSRYFCWFFDNRWDMFMKKIRKQGHLFRKHVLKDLKKNL